MHRMAPQTFKVHTTLLFDPKTKSFRENVSIEVDPATGSIVGVEERESGSHGHEGDDIDLCGKVVMPGFVDAHTHIFLHSYE
jgi:cytosine/adenosine deaminase-related metal-dependent hydrolase